MLVLKQLYEIGPCCLDDIYWRCCCCYKVTCPLTGLCVQGCLKPVQLSIPKGCILDPSQNAAVVGGNVLTSQRVVDVVLKAFGVCAASQVRIRPW